MFSTAWNSASRSAVERGVGAEVAGAFSIAAPTRAVSWPRRVDRAGTGSPAARERADEARSDISSSPWKMLSASAATSRSRTGRSPCAQHDVVAERLVQHVGHRVRVGDDRDRLVRSRWPNSSSHGFARSASVAASEPGTQKRPASMNRRLTPRMRGLVGWYRFRQLASSPGRTRNGSIRDVGDVGQAERLAPVALVGIVRERQQQIDEQRVAAGARMTIGRVDVAAGGTRRPRSG